ncbi:MAG: mannose-1-phosphate guanylyltransferase/mannose-6-phosphate isomerase [Alphaproteobacteria bacterium]|nr:mannose-1-phosphate guanylyltransferase/mannose-6-phosphate isomerase [Alphaproteobacteria bacterium]
MALIYPIILCGGSGTRLWPVSRKSMPKQFVQLVGEQTLFQQACGRCTGANFAPPIIITSSDYRFIAAQQLAELGIKPTAILLEPEGKNTAPAILAAARYLQDHDSDALMVVMSSDHAIPDEAAFTKMIEASIMPASGGNILTFGIHPDRPEVGYGYIEYEESSDSDFAIPVRAFHEKPDLERAQAMLNSGRYLWNAGIFMAASQTFLDAGLLFVPDMMQMVEKAVAGMTGDLDFLRLEATSWSAIIADSVDYALMEKADNILVVKFAGSWLDLGDWQAVKHQLAHGVDDVDASGNLIKGNTVQIDTENSLLWSAVEGQALVAAGVSNIVAVAMSDAVLVADLSKTQSVKKAVELLKIEQISQAEQHARDWRPWGWFDSLVIAQGYQVKRLHVYPGGRLSLQSHKHRSEHWVVTDGHATIQIEDKEFTLEVNQSTYIEVGQKHRLSNHTDKPLTIIEVQTGSYLGEDDIIRFEDSYKR